MTLQNISVEATGASLAIALNTDDLMKLFGSRNQAVNLNWMSVEPLAFGTAVDVFIQADHPDKIDETDGDGTSFDFTRLKLLNGINGVTALFDEASEPRAKSIYRFTTADVAGKLKAFSTFPIFNNLIIGWSADVDFLIEMDFTILDTNWDFREEIMDLLAGKRQVQDPNIDMTQGKRQLLRAPLLRR